MCVEEKKYHGKSNILQIKTLNRLVVCLELYTFAFANKEGCFLLRNKNAEMAQLVEQFIRNE